MAEWTVLREALSVTAAGMVGWQEALFVAVVILLIFGARRLPEIGKSLGSGIREFKKSVTGEEDTEALEDQRDRSGNSGVKASVGESQPAEKK